MQNANSTVIEGGQGDATQFEETMNISNTENNPNVSSTATISPTEAVTSQMNSTTNTTVTVGARSQIPSQTNPTYWTTELWPHAGTQPPWRPFQPTSTQPLRFEFPPEQSYRSYQTPPRVPPRSANPFYTEPTFINPAPRQPMTQAPVYHQYQPEQTAPTVTYAQLPYPRLTPNDIEAWFMSWGFWFDASGIVDDSRKFNTILAALDPATLPQLSGILSSVPPINRYEYIKERITKHYRESNQKIINRLLSDMTLGDLKPSRLYFDMKRAADSIGITDEALKELWARRLPDYARISIAGTGRSPAEFTQQADAIVEALRSSTIAAVSTSTQSNPPSPNPSTDASGEMAALIAGIQELTREFRARGNSRSRSTNRDRSSSRNNRGRANSRSNECWYHRTFGKKATKCEYPCRHYKEKNTTESKE